MTAKVKVQFISPTEMELSNEAGQRVRYKKLRRRTRGRKKELRGSL